MLLAGTLLAVLLPGARPASAHPLPGSAVLLDLHEHSVTAELRLPVQDLTAASGLGPRNSAAIRSYLRAHLRPTTTRGAAWQVRLGELSLAEDQQNGTGPFPVLVAQAELTPPDGNVRHFVLGYDAIVHQVATHLIVVSVRHDRRPGRSGPAIVGVIAIDIRTMAVPALRVDLEAGSDRPDHLLFLLLPVLMVVVTRSRHGEKVQTGRR